MTDKYGLASTTRLDHDTIADRALEQALTAMHHAITVLTKGRLADIHEIRRARHDIKRLTRLAWRAALDVDRQRAYEVAVERMADVLFQPTRVEHTEPRRAYGQPGHWTGD